MNYVDIPPERVNDEACKKKVNEWIVELKEKYNCKIVFQHPFEEILVFGSELVPDILRERLVAFRVKKFIDCEHPRRGGIIEDARSYLKRLKEVVNEYQNQPFEIVEQPIRRQQHSIEIQTDPPSPTAVVHEKHTQTSSSNRTYVHLVSHSFEQYGLHSTEPGIIRLIGQQIPRSILQWHVKTARYIFSKIHLARVIALMSSVATVVIPKQVVRGKIQFPPKGISVATVPQCQQSISCVCRSCLSTRLSECKKVLHSLVADVEKNLGCVHRDSIIIASATMNSANRCNRMRICSSCCRCKSHCFCLERKKHREADRRKRILEEDGIKRAQNDLFRKAHERLKGVRKFTATPVEELSPQEIVRNRHLAPHRILGIPYDATRSEIKQRYRKLVLHFHPDKALSNAATTDAFIVISEAYKVIMSRH